MPSQKTRHQKLNCMHFTKYSVWSPIMHPCSVLVLSNAHHYNTLLNVIFVLTALHFPDIIDLNTELCICSITLFLNQDSSNKTCYIHVCLIGDEIV